MQASSLTVALVSALLIAGAGIGGALAATGPLQPQQSPTGTTGVETTAAGTGTTGISSGTSGPGTTTLAGSSTGTTAGASGESGPSVTFNDQQSSGGSVLVQSATLPEDGFIAIYDSTRSGNATNQIIGSSYLLNAGTSDNIRIQLDEPISSSKSLTAVVHTDTNGNGEFDYVSSNAEQDKPLTQNGRRIVDIAQVSTQSTSAGSTNQAAGGTTASGASGANASTQSGGAGNASANGSANGGTSGSSGPGFGLVVAVVALLAVALLAVRRN